MYVYIGPVNFRRYSVVKRKESKDSMRERKGIARG